MAVRHSCALDLSYPQLDNARRAELEVARKMLER